MRITEIDSSFYLTETSSEINVLLTVLQYVKARMEEKNITDKKIKTDTLITLIKNSGFPAFDYEVLSNLFTTNELVKQHIQDINKQVVSFTSDEVESDEGLDVKKQTGDQTEKKVSALAKKAAKI